MSFSEILNSFSSPIAIKILKTYSNSNNGINLSHTAELINEKISTVKDHLKKLVKTRILYKINKLYYLSNFGSFIFDLLTEIETLSKTREIFGQLSANMIPSKILLEFLPYIKEIPIISNQWLFLTISNKLLSQIQTELEKKPIELKVLGWNSLVLGFEIIKNSFKQISFDKNSLIHLLNNLNLILISDKSIIKELLDSKNQDLRNIVVNPETKERFQVTENVDRFKFITIRYNDIIHFFLNEKEKMGIGPYFIIEKKPGAIEVFDQLFEHFLRLAKPLCDYI
ncbi:MAG: hypothetical protein ACFFAS_06515 [Promethearchaeota archaeon]